MSKYIDDNGLKYYDEKIKTRLSNKVDKIDGKGLSSNDYTLDDKNKLAGVATGAQVNVIESIEINGVEAQVSGKKASVTIEAGKIDEIKVNGTAQQIVNKAVNISVPTNTNQLTNGAGFQNASEVQALIDSAMEGITGIDFQVVDVLPTNGVKGVIYLVPNSGTSPNAYDEYIWLSASSRYEKIGTTEIDLSNYWSKTELVVITNTEIDDITK